MKIQNPTIQQITELTGEGANLTGSFSGSIDASTFASPGLNIVSGSAQLASDISGSLGANAALIRTLTAATISGSFTSTSASIATDVETNTAKLTANTTNVKAALDADLGGTATIGDSNDTIIIAGNLTVQGTETTLNTENLTVEDKLISVASGSADNAAANGAGLHVSGSDAEFVYASSGDKWTMNKFLDLDTNNFNAHDVETDSLGVGTSASGTTGEIRATNDITAFYSSDERLKENIVTLDGALDKVKAMRGVTFDWKELSEEDRKTIHSHEGHDLGVIAQEVQAQYPELVHQRDHGYLSVDYVKLTAVLIEAVKELSAKVDELSK